MVDMSFIGKNGFIIQYEDIISLWGYNALLKLKESNLIDRESSTDSLLLDYFNREIENPFTYINEKYHVNFPIDAMYKSKKVLRPNMLYAFKIFLTAYQNGIKELLVFSNKRSSIIDKYIKNEIPDIPIKYVHGDVVPVIKQHPNCTFLTSDTNIIKRFVDEDIPPFALTIVDTFSYVAPVVKDSFVELLRRKGVYVGFTNILSAGLIP
jgi:hypothetical protein